MARRPVAKQTIQTAWFRVKETIPKAILLLYRYYLSTRDNKEGYGASGVRMLPAGEVEGAVLAQLRANLRYPDMADHETHTLAHI